MGFYTIYVWGVEAKLLKLCVFVHVLACLLQIVYTLQFCWPFFQGRLLFMLIDPNDSYEAESVPFKFENP